MLSKKRIIVSSFATVIAAGAIGVSVTNADFNHKYQGHSVIEGTMKNNNFKDSADECPMIDSKDRQKEFSAITIAHNLKKEGKHKQAQEILEDAGIEHPGKEIIRYKRNFNIKDAIEHGNWKEFKHSVKGKKMANVIDTEEKFRLLTEVHALHEKDRHVEANKIMKELGLHHHHMK